MLRNQPTDHLLSSAIGDNQNNKKGLTSPGSEARNSRSNQGETNQKKEKKSQFGQVLKIFNIIVGFVLVGFSAYSYWGITNSTNENGSAYRAPQLLRIILPGYVGVSGLIILLSECGIPIIRRNLRFLSSFIGRGLFNVYVGVMPLAILPDNPQTSSQTTLQILTYVVVSFMTVIGVLYVVAGIFCCSDGNNKEDSDDDD